MAETETSISDLQARVENIKIEGEGLRKILELNYVQDPDETQEQYVERNMKKVYRFILGVTKKEMELLDGKNSWKANNKIFQNLDLDKAEDLSKMVGSLAMGISMTYEAGINGKILSHLMVFMRNFDYKDKKEYINKIKSTINNDVQKEEEVRRSGMSNGYVVPAVYENVVKRLMEDFEFDKPSCKQEGFVGCIKEALDTLISKTDKIIKNKDYTGFDENKVGYDEFFSKDSLSYEDIMGAITAEGTDDKGRPNYEVEIDKVFGDNGNLRQIRLAYGQNKGGKATISIYPSNGDPQINIPLDKSEIRPLTDSLQYLHSKVRPIDTNDSVYTRRFKVKLTEI